MKCSDTKFFYYSIEYCKLSDTFKKPSEVEEFPELHGCFEQFQSKQQKVSKENEDKAIEIISKQKQKFSFYTSESENLDNIQSLYWLQA